MIGDNNIPKGWVETTLGEVCLIGSSKRSFFCDYVEDCVPFYRSKEIIEKQKGESVSTSLFITEKKFNEIEEKFGAPKYNDLLITSVGTLGVPYIVQENERFYFKDGNLTWFRNYDGINPVFLYNWFLSSIGKESLKQITIGSTQSALTITGLKSIPILLPPLPEQQAIATILTSFDDKIELLQAQNKTLETIAQTIFKEWFGKYQVGDELPKGWRVGKLGEEFDITMGQSPPGKSYNTDNNGTVFFQGRAEFTNRFPEVRLYTTEPKRMSDKFDVLVSVRAPVGDINVALDKCCIGRGLAAVSSIYKSYCLYKLKLLKPIFDLFESEGTVFGSINKTSFSNIKIIIPTDLYVIELDSILSTLDTKIYNNYLQIQTLQQTRDTLLPKLMSGKLRVEEFRE